MQIVLIDTDRIYLEILPTTVSGKYTVGNSSDNPYGILSIEADTNKQVWVAKSGKIVQYFCEGDDKYAEMELEIGMTYEAHLGEELRKAYLIVVEEDTNLSAYTKYRIKNNSVITVGRENDSNIQLANPLVSSNHLKLSYQNQCWAVLEAKGRNGTYINSMKVDGATPLLPGDVINILYYKIIIGYDFIAVNNPQLSVSVHSDCLSVIYNVPNNQNISVELEEQKYYYRSPRIAEPFETKPITVDLPPNPEKRDDTPMLLTVAPAMLMGLASLSTGVISIINTLQTNGSILRAVPTILMSVSMLGGMVIFPIIMKKRMNRKAEEKEQERQDKYLRYLQSIRDEIAKCKLTQEKKQSELHPEIVSYASGENFWERNLWERTIDHSDFLEIRLGLGNADMDLDISFSTDKFGIEEDSLRDEMLQLQKTERLLLNVPITISLMKERVFGIIGERKDVQNVLNSLFLQIFLLHSYDEVKVVFLHDESDEETFRYVNKAQHIWDDKCKKRFLAVTSNNLRELNIGIGSIFNRRLRDSSSNQMETMPYYIIVSTSQQMTNRCSFISEVLSHPEMQNVSVVCAYDEITHLPKECHVYATVTGGRGTLLQNGVLKGFLQDSVSVTDAERLIGKMSNIYLDLMKGKFDLPEMLSFMDMYQAGNYRHLNIIQRWKENNPIKSLRAPVGVDTNGEIFYLDLHEKMHGPHGLVAGMTGSGKSEFLITYILSMAINYHPDEVAFVLIDYKGGGLVGAFENDHYRLPHLAGTITNLDENEVIRAILSIKSELKKRQIIFRKACDIANEGTMDIYKYQKMYREGKVSEAIPHLFIIADEFAELKTQHPEFLEQLISTARIGRSLGVHLILATQKPNGVVNEQIWANSKFKVCLKVQDRADSIDMLKCPDAAELKETGRFYLQVGYNELFELGQSAWAGAPYVERETGLQEDDATIEMIDELGNVIESIKGESETAKSSGMQIVRVMEHLASIASFMAIEEKLLWEPELPAYIPIEKVRSEYGSKYPGKYSFIIGEVDDVYNQKREALCVDLVEKGNVLLYGAVGSGKEMFLTTLLYSMYRQCTPDELHTYLLDFGSEFLGNFESAPHTKAVALDGEDDKIAVLLTHLKTEMKKRRRILAESGQSFWELNEDFGKMPVVVVVVNNLQVFDENYNKYSDDFSILTREGQKYGIFFVVAVLGATAVRYRVAQNFTNRFVLKLTDKSEYVSILGSTGGVYPAAGKGRGILKQKETYSFQVASIVETERENREVILRFCKELIEKYGNQQKTKLRSVPRYLLGKDIVSKEWGIEKIPLGMNWSTVEMEEINLSEKGVLFVLAAEQVAADAFLRGLTDAMKQSSDEIILFNYELYKRETGETKVTMTEKKLEELFNTALARHLAFRNEGIVESNKKLVIIQDYYEMMNQLSVQGLDNLDSILLKVQKFWNISFVVCDTYDHAKKYSLHRWVQNRRDCILWIGPGLESQILYAIKDKKMLGNVGPTTGFLIEKESVTQIRVLSDKIVEEGEQ